MISRQYAFGLLILTGLFAFRVIAQFVQVISPIDFLPAYSEWHSGALPYSLLLAVQVIILAICLRIVWNVCSRTIAFSRKKGNILFALGILYFISMGARLILGLTVASGHFWFDAVLPTIFHLVLASFVILYGLSHLRGSQSLSGMNRGERL